MRSLSSSRLWMSRCDLADEAHPDLLVGGAGILPVLIARDSGNEPDQPLQPFRDGDSTHCLPPLDLSGRARTSGRSVQADCQQDFSPSLLKSKEGRADCNAPSGRVCQSADTSWRASGARIASLDPARRRQLRKRRQASAMPGPDQHRAAGGRQEGDRLAREPARLAGMEGPHPGPQPPAHVLPREGLPLDHVRGDRVEHELRARGRDASRPAPG